MANDNKEKKILRLIISLINRFFGWVFSNLVWTIIAFITPIGVVVPNILQAIKGKVFTTSNIAAVAIVIFVEVIFLCLYLYSKKRKESGAKKESEEENNPNVDADEYNKLDFYFEEYHKHLTVYKNGNGIIIHSFTIVVNDLNSILLFKRQLKIEDAKKSTVFPSLEEMKSTDLQHRFEKFCFSYKCINNNDLIRSVEERYWTDDSDNDDDTAREDPKNLKWIMKMNSSAIKAGEAYKIVYVISIPGMFPIDNGFFREDISNKKGTNGVYVSMFKAKHRIKNFIITISFENGLELYKKPVGKIFSGQKDSNIQYDNDNNIIYDKYIFRANGIDVGSSINIEWYFQKNNM